MQIAINGWFAGRPDTGSGQYIQHLLAHLPLQDAGVRFVLLVPQTHSLRSGKTAASGKRQAASFQKQKGEDERLGFWLRPAASSQQPAANLPNVTPVPVLLPAWPENWRKLWWEQVAAPRAAARLGADLYWTPYWAAPWWQPMPVCVTIHDLIPRLLPAYRGGLLQRLYTALVSHTARRSAAVLTVSQASARDIARHLHVPGPNGRPRLHVVYHGPNQPGPRPKRAPSPRPPGAIYGADPKERPAQLDLVRAKYGLPARFFLYLGGFDMRKNVAATIDAYRRYLALGGDPAVKLVMAGTLPCRDSDIAPDPRRLAAALGVAESVICCGWVDEEDKPALYALATAFVFPSLYEGFGMMVLEAMAAGTPVITSRAAGG
jgi:glycosyltransferase involved in cell wall biosynthesis